MKQQCVTFKRKPNEEQLEPIINEFLEKHSNYKVHTMTSLYNPDYKTEFVFVIFNIED